MSDKLEKFIIENKAQFDTEEPSSGLWDRIEEDLPKEKERSFDANWIWKVAAMIFLASTLVLLIQRQDASDASIAEVQHELENAELTEVEFYYNSMISTKREEISKYLAAGTINEPEFLQDLDALDAMYQELKEDLKQNANNQRLINAMIQNLQLRVEILNKQLSILEQIKNYEENDKIII